MASTYTLIASNTLSTSAASVTFSSIPATYTDLVVRASVRSNSGGSIADSIRLTINGSTLNQSFRFVRGNGSSVVSSSGTSASLGNASNGSASTANTFSNVELYIPSYTASQNKPISGFWTQEDNSTTAYIYAEARLWSVTTAINSLSFNLTGINLGANSSFFLYGIKNS
jgi:hypothetical protein